MLYEIGFNLLIQQELINRKIEEKHLINKRRSHIELKNFLIDIKR
jgi:hypothetical protein